MDSDHVRRREREIETEIETEREMESESVQDIGGDRQIGSGENRPQNQKPNK